MTLAPRDNKIMKEESMTFPNLFDELNTTELNTNVLNVNNGIYVQEEGLPEITTITPTQIATPLVATTNIQATVYDFVQTVGIVQMNNCDINVSSSGNSGKHLQVEIDGVLYKIRLENA